MGSVLDQGPLLRGHALVMDAEPIPWCSSTAHGPISWQHMTLCKRVCSSIWRQASIAQPFSSVKSCTVAPVCVLLSRRSSHAHTLSAMLRNDVAGLRHFTMRVPLCNYELHTGTTTHCVCDCVCDCVQCSVPIYWHPKALLEQPEQRLVGRTTFSIHKFCICMYTRVI